MKSWVSLSCASLSEAAKLLASAGHVREAADLTADTADESDLAAELYEKAGDWQKAGEIHERNAGGSPRHGSTIRTTRGRISP